MSFWFCILRLLTPICGCHAWYWNLDFDFSAFAVNVSWSPVWRGRRHVEPKKWQNDNLLGHSFKPLTVDPDHTVVVGKKTRVGFSSLSSNFFNWFPKISKLLDMDAAIFDFQYIESYILYFTILQLKIMVQFNLDMNMLLPIPCEWKTRTNWFKCVDN